MDYSYISNEGSTLFLHRYGAKLQFSSPTSCTAFLQSIKGGRAAMVDAIVKNNIFVDVVVANADAATTIVDDYFGKRSAFYLIGTMDDFLAREHDAATLEGAFTALFEYTTAVLEFAPLEKTIESTGADATYPQFVAKVFEGLHSMSQGKPVIFPTFPSTLLTYYHWNVYTDSVKSEKWLAQHAALRAKRESKDPLPIVEKPGDNPMWSLTTFNATKKQTLTYDGHLPINMVDGYTIVQQPSPSFTMGFQTLSWYCNYPWFAYGGDGAGLVWKTITGRKFGIDIYVPMVYFGVGSDPYYSVWRDDFAHWIQPPGGPSAPYTFPDGSGYTVQVTPTCAGKELFVQMHIETESSSEVDPSTPIDK